MNSIIKKQNKITFWKPTWFQRLMYFIGFMKDPRYNGKKINRLIHDEIGVWVD